MTMPPTELRPSVYSNIDHDLDTEVAEKLKEQAGEVYAQHAAWDFCGYIWFADDKWHDQVWVYGAAVETMTDDDLPTLIAAVNDRYGHA